MVVNWNIPTAKLHNIDNPVKTSPGPPVTAQRRHPTQERQQGNLAEGNSSATRLPLLSGYLRPSDPIIRMCCKNIHHTA